MVLHMHGLISWAFIFFRWQFFTAFSASCSVLVDIVHIFTFVLSRVFGWNVLSSAAESRGLPFYRCKD